MVWTDRPWDKYLTSETEDSKKESDETSLPTREPINKVITLPAPSDSDHALTAMPLIRNWLFAPDRSKLRWRRFETDVIHQGKRVTQALTIGDRRAAAGFGYGVLRTRHQKAIFALQHLWQKQGGRMVLWNGRRHGTICASSWELEHLIYGSHGGRQSELVAQMMQELSSIPVEIENYIRSDGSLGTLSVSGLIGEVVFSTAARNGQLGFPWVEISLGSIITNAFENAAVKPLNLKVLGDIKSDIAAILYPKLDHYLATNDRVELRLDTLVTKMGMTAKQLRKKSYRRSKFLLPAAELQGAPLSKPGYVLDLRIEPTKDGQDYKLIAERKRAKKS